MKRIPLWLPFLIAAAFAVAFAFEHKAGLDSDWSVPIWYMAGPGLLVSAIGGKLSLTSILGEEVGFGLGLFAGMLGYNLAMRVWWNGSKWSVPLRAATYLAVSIGGGYICNILMISMLAHFQGSFWQAIGIHTN